MNTTNGTMRLQTTESNSGSTKDAYTKANADDAKTPKSKALVDATFVDVHTSNLKDSSTQITPGALRKEVKKDQQISDLGLALDEVLTK